MLSRGEPRFDPANIEPEPDEGMITIHFSVPYEAIAPADTADDRHVAWPGLRGNRWLAEQLRTGSTELGQRFATTNAVPPGPRRTGVGVLLCLVQVVAPTVFKRENLFLLRAILPMFSVAFASRVLYSGRVTQQVAG